MCGVTGGLTFTRFSKLSAALPAMTRAIAHRGPDRDGYWLDPNAGIALGHRRLAILDLTAEGNQPMISRTGRYVLAYNGEIYNHNDLRGQLGTASLQHWRGHSDTETLLACIEAWGVQRTLRASVGMFAFALWDRETSSLTLARDRFGEKPMYYGWQGETFLFGSELKALKAHPDFLARVDRNALALLLQYNYIPSPYSIWEGIQKLPPGTCLEVRNRSLEQSYPFWSFADVAVSGSTSPLDVTPSEAVDEVESSLRRSVRQQMVADVPLGALLSGGVDSSAVVALMQSDSSRPVKTFSIGFTERAFDESAHAAAVARHLRTDHTELIIGTSDVLNLVPEMPRVYDEPFADSSQLPTSLVLRLASQHVTVALSGDAGDELFGGYNRYLLAPRIWKTLKWIPEAARNAAARAVLGVSTDSWNVVTRPLSGLLRQRQMGDKLHKLAHRMKTSGSFDGLYSSLVTEWARAEDMVRGADQPGGLLRRPSEWPALHNPIERMMALDTLTYLPDDILVKVDRAAMAASLETRAPFLDHRLAELAWRIPMHYKIRDGDSKWVLKQVLYRHVPKALVDRPKMGFGVPLDQWLRGPLRDWAETLLDEQRLREEGYFDATPIRSAWQQHLRGDASLGYRLWSVLMFQAWLEPNKSAAPQPELEEVT